MIAMNAMNTFAMNAIKPNRIHFHFGLFSSFNGAALDGLSNRPMPNSSLQAAAHSFVVTSFNQDARMNVAAKQATGNWGSNTSLQRAVAQEVTRKDEPFVFPVVNSPGNPFMNLRLAPPVSDPFACLRVLLQAKERVGMEVDWDERDMEVDWEEDDMEVDWKEGDMDWEMS